jgi:glycosyltransferase involved in cell wall biosynthesis
VLPYADRVMAVSEGIKNELIARGINGSKIRLIPNAVTSNGRKEECAENRKSKRKLFNIPEHEFVIGYIGRLSEEKGVRYLIETHRLLAKAGVPARMLIIGDGPQRKELKHLASTIGDGKSVIFTGFQNNIEDWLPTMDVFVLPSLTEGTPMALLEAMAGGIPVIASAVGGVPQVIKQGKNGLLIEPGRTEEIHKAVLDLYNNEQMRENLSRAAEETIKQNYSVQQWIRSVEREYVNTIN